MHLTTFFTIFRVDPDGNYMPTLNARNVIGAASGGRNILTIQHLCRVKKCTPDAYLDHVESCLPLDIHEDYKVMP